MKKSFEVTDFNLTDILWRILGGKNLSVELWNSLLDTEEYFSYEEIQAVPKSMDERLSKLVSKYGSCVSN